MKNNIGVWLDTEKAYLITLTDDSFSVERVDSEVETRIRFEGETKSYSRKGSQLVNPSKKSTHRKKHQIKQFFDVLTEKISDAEMIYLFGPAETKLHLAKHLEKIPNCKNKLCGVETEGHLTENQMVACVKKVFDKVCE